MLIAAAVLLAVLASALALAWGAVALGVAPAWLAGARHALAEARWRVAGVLTEFGDWLRLGR